MECLYCGCVIPDGMTKCPTCGAPVSATQYEEYKRMARRKAEEDLKKTPEPPVVETKSYSGMGPFEPIYDNLVRPFANLAQKTKDTFRGAADKTPESFHATIPEDPFVEAPTVAPAAATAAKPKKKKHFLLKFGVVLLAALLVFVTVMVMLDENGVFDGDGHWHDYSSIPVVNYVSNDIALGDNGSGVRKKINEWASLESVDITDNGFTVYTWHSLDKRYEIMVIFRNDRVTYKEIREIGR